VFGSRVWLLIEPGTGDPTWRQGSVLGARVYEPGSVPTVKLHIKPTAAATASAAAATAAAGAAAGTTAAGTAVKPSTESSVSDAPAAVTSAVTSANTSTAATSSGVNGGNSATASGSGGAAVEQRTVGAPRPVRAAAAMRASDAHEFGEVSNRYYNR
jgi:hypothetical protein